MSGFLNKVGDMAKSAAATTSELAKQAADKGSAAVEVARINGKIREERNSIDEVKKQIGQKIYQAQQRGGEFGPEIEKLCGAIEAGEASIASLELEIKHIKES